MSIMQSEPNAAAGARFHVVTGAFGYSGRYIADRLVRAGLRVRTLTNSPHKPNPWGAAVETRPLHFDDPAALADALRGAAVLYNTYWVRFNHRTFTHAAAVAHTRTLFEAARAAGVERVVHVSITNPSEDSPLEYFRGKAQLERALQESGLSYAILRPAVLFGGDDILINNIAWALRHLPAFGYFGDGRYRLRPIHVEDLAALAVAQGARRENVTLDAVGPESYAYRDLVRLLRDTLGVWRPLLPVPPWLGYGVSRMIGWWMRDVMMTREEIAGLMAGLLDTASPAAGAIRLSEWAREHADRLGRRYACELARRAKTAI